MINLNKLKSLLEKIPPQPGVFFNKIPFKYRLGEDYDTNYKEADFLLNISEEDKIKYIINGFKNIIIHFIKNKNKLIIDHLNEANLNLSDIKQLSDIAAIPLTSKLILQKVPLYERTTMGYGLRQCNTTGTSGNPLSFFLDKNCYSREWAHIHYMWKKIGYESSKTKITIRGKHYDTPYIYNFNQNEFLLNSYQDFDNKDYLEMFKIFKKYNTEYIHGYPSSIYNFIKTIAKKAPFLLDFFKKNIKGILFASEYPSPHYRNYIEEHLTSNTISWYGHTEGVILASEIFNKYEYIPFLSYGYAEAVKSGDYYHLIGTSFKNFATPFIRYDTEDLINPNINKEGRLVSFEVKEGRLGEFILDKFNNTISLTAFIFSRQHKLFNYANFIQVQQIAPGKIIIYFSSPAIIENPDSLFDSSNVNMDILFKRIDEPVRTRYGKIPLLIK